jgi:hypothetical protein
MSSVEAWENLLGLENILLISLKKVILCGSKTSRIVSIFKLYFIDKPGTKQQLTNLVVIEAGLYVDTELVNCGSATLV